MSFTEKQIVVRIVVFIASVHVAHANRSPQGSNDSDSSSSTDRNLSPTTDSTDRFTFVTSLNSTSSPDSPGNNTSQIGDVKRASKIQLEPNSGDGYAQIRHQSSDMVTSKPNNSDNSGGSDATLKSNDQISSDSGANSTTHLSLPSCESINATLQAIPDNRNCSHFYEVCFYPTPHSTLNGVSDFSHKILKSCPIGEFFDSIDLRCSMKVDGYCGTYRCKQPNGLFPDPQNCEKFIQCLNGKPTRKMCEPNGTVFDQRLQRCVHYSKDLPVALKLFETLIWVVQITGPKPNSSRENDGRLHSTEDYVTASLVAILIPLIYILTLLTLYKEFCDRFKPTETDPFVTDTDDDFGRYSTPNPPSRMFCENPAASSRNGAYYASTPL